MTSGATSRSLKACVGWHVGFGVGWELLVKRNGFDGFDSLNRCLLTCLWAILGCALAKVQHEIHFLSADWVRGECGRGAEMDHRFGDSITSGSFLLYFTVIQLPRVSLQLYLDLGWKSLQRDFALYFSRIELPRSNSGGCFWIWLKTWDGHFALYFPMQSTPPDFASWFGQPLQNRLTGPYCCETQWTNAVLFLSGGVDDQP